MADASMNESHNTPDDRIDRMLRNLPRPSDICLPPESEAYEETRYGLFPETFDSNEYIMDVVIVHGIRSSPWTTDFRYRRWKPLEGQKPSSAWLADIFPSSRMMHFHYENDGPANSNLNANVLSPEGVDLEAANLLNSLTNERLERTGRNEGRQLAFVCCDVGGIIVKKALILAYLNPTKYHGILSHMFCMVSIECPQRGDQTELEDFFIQLFHGIPAIQYRFLETVAAFAATTQRINSELHDTKVLMSIRNITISNPLWFSDVPVLDAPNEVNVNIDGDLVTGGDRQNVLELLLDRLYRKDRDIHLYFSHSERFQQTLLSQSPSLVPFRRSGPDWYFTAEAAIERFENNERAKSWRNSSGPSILHLRCSAKTARELPRMLCSELRRSEPDAIFFEFSQHDDRLNNSQSCFSSLVCQYTCRQVAQPDYDSTWSIAKSQQSWTDRHVRQLWAYLQASDSDLDLPVYYIIACVDECDESRYGLVEFFATAIASHKKPVRVIFSTTKNCDKKLESLLSTWPTLDDQDVMEESAKTPLALYGTKVFTERSIQQLLKLNPALLSVQSEIEELVESCGHDYELAHTIIDWLRDNKLATRKCSTVRMNLIKLAPPTPEAFLSNVLQSFGKRSARARSIISWIKCSFEPPTIWELGQGVHIGCSDTEYIDVEDIDLDDLRRDVRQLRGLVTFDGHEVDLEPIGRRALFNESCECTASTHADMASICLRYLVQPSARGALEQLVENFMFLDEAPRSRPRFSLAAYAVQFWPKHYQLAGSQGPWALAVAFFENITARNLWAQVAYVLSNPLTRLHRSYTSPLPLVAMTGLDGLVSHILETERRASRLTNIKTVGLDVGLALVEAARCGKTSTVMKLLEASRTEENTLSEALLAAASNADEVMFKLLFDASVKFKDFPWPPDIFLRLSWLGLLDSAKLLLAAGVPISPPGVSRERSSLHLAIQGNHTQMTQLLIDANIDLNGRLELDIPALHVAVRCRSLEAMKLLLVSGADPNIEDEGCTPLQRSIFLGYTRVSMVLLIAGADPNRGVEELRLRHENPAAMKPIIIAAKKGFTECTRILLEYGADFEILTEGWSPLRYAVVEGHIGVSRMLMERGADPNKPLGRQTLIELATRNRLAATTKVELLTLLWNRVVFESEYQSKNRLQDMLFRSVDGEEIEVVQFLLDHGVSPNFGDDSNESPLIRALRYDSVDIPQLLLGKGADVQTTFRTWAPLHFAQSRDSVSLVKLLLRHNADIDCLCNCGTVTYLAAMRNQIGLVEQLLAHSPKPDLEIELLYQSGARHVASYEDGMTALCIACQRGNPRIIQLLLEAGANINHRTKNGSRPVDLALRSASFFSVQVLLEFRPILDLTDDDGNRVLHHIKHDTPVSCVGLLYSAGADIHTSNQKGHTPLMEAAIALNHGVVNFLLGKGADVNARSADGLSLLYVAAWAGHWSMFKAFVDRGADVKAADNSGYQQSLLFAVATSRAASEGRVRIAEYLVNEAGLDPNQHSPETQAGYPILTAILTLNAEPLVQSLLKVGSDVNVSDSLGRTVLHYAALVSPKTLRAILAKSPDPNVPTKMGTLPLHFFARSGTNSSECLNILLEWLEGGAVKPQVFQDNDTREESQQESVEDGHRGTLLPTKGQSSEESTLAAMSNAALDIDVKDKDGWTPLMWAAKCSNDTDALRLLLHRGADLWVVDKGPTWLWTPLKLARYIGAMDGFDDLLVPRDKIRMLPDGTVEEWDDKVHEVDLSHPKIAVNCRFCWDDIYGINWSCVDCDFNLCFKCFRGKDVLHPWHDFERFGPQFESSDAEEDEEFVTSYRIAADGQIVKRNRQNDEDAEDILLGSLDDEVSTGKESN